MRFTTSVGAQYSRRASIDSVARAVPSSRRPASSTSWRRRRRIRNRPGLQRRQVARLLRAGAVRLARSVLPRGGARSDDHSAFGAAFNRVVSEVLGELGDLSDEPWFQVPVIGNESRSLRLRRIRRIGQGTDGLFVDPDVHPDGWSERRRRGHAEHRSATRPRSGEEQGDRARLRRQRGATGGLEFTYYNKKTIDAILDQVVAPSIGPVGHAADQHRRHSQQGSELRSHADHGAV